MKSEAQDLKKYHRDDAAFTSGLVQLQQRGVDSFTVVYGLDVRRNLDYAQAARELGCGLMHQLACDSMIDNRTKAEARADARTES